MSDLVRPGASPFDAIRRVDAEGECWSGRDLMPVMGYGADWRNFADAVSRAKVACENTGEPVSRHFGDVTEKSNGGRPRSDYRLTRYAAYLVAMNGDPRKPEVAAAQTYFAVKTREAETRVIPDLSSCDGQLALLDMFRDEVERRRAVELANAGLTQENAEMRPKVNAADAMRHWDGAYKIGDVAQMFGKGQNTLFKILYDEGILRRDNRRPYQEYLNKGWFRVVAKPRDVRDEHGKLIRVVTDYTTLIYPDGALKLHEYLTKRGYELLRPRLSSELPLFALEPPPSEPPQLPPGGVA